MFFIYILFLILEKTYRRMVMRVSLYELYPRWYKQFITRLTKKMKPFEIRHYNFPPPGA